MALASGATFAGFTVARRLGSGSTGEVYLVQDLVAVCWRALKVLSPELSSDPEFRGRFQRETPIAANLYHPHIVGVHDRGEFDGRLFVAMDYVEGISAAQLMAGRFPAVSPVSEVLAMVTDIAGALDYAHQRGLLHRDVKPGNILVSRGEGEQRVALSDFGISPPMGSLGAPGYTAPEWLRGAEPDGRSDQYALAATAFHLLSGAPPGSEARLSEQRPELARLDVVFAKALAARPADRFRTCGEFAEAANEHAGVLLGDRSPEAVMVAEYPAYGGVLRSVAPDGPAEHRSAAARAQPVRHTSDPLRRRRPRKLVLGAAAVVLLVGLVAAAFVIGRTTGTTATPSGRATTGASPAAAAPPVAGPAAAPVPLDGTYRLDVERTKETFNYISNPQPPDVNTWWAFRSSCTPTACTASAIQLDDTDHRQLAGPGNRELSLQFREGEWQSQPADAQFACVGPDGETKTQLTTLVLSLRPQPQGDLDGEETVTVQSNECGQRSAVMRVPTVLSRSGEVPPGVTVPNPAPGPPDPNGPVPQPSGPHR
ncbi:serine/threonine-protein kinase [Mycobacterium parmense]|nr:serine/threonine-protein kinase [Mycobacterium parmense]MCV7351487.1 serine/threonine protein kinase [Mycobacterium parmense]ORW57537.1 hypothetical protein AWC20_13175 [Mycobacterium parmense]